MGYTLPNLILRASLILLMGWLILMIECIRLCLELLTPTDQLMIQDADQDNQNQEEKTENPQFDRWDVLIPELRHHALSFLDRTTMLNYSQCSKISNEEVQKFDTKAPLSVEVKDLRDGQTGVFVKLDYKKVDLGYGPDVMMGISIDVVEALIDIAAHRGDLILADDARNRLAVVREQPSNFSQFQKELIIIAAVLVGVDPDDDLPVLDEDVRLEDVPILDALLLPLVDYVPEPDFGRYDNLPRWVGGRGFLLHRTIEDALEKGGFTKKHLRKRRCARMRRENWMYWVEVKFVAVGPNQHKMILNRPSDVEDGILEGNAVDAAYEYLEKRFKYAKTSVNEITLDVKKWPAKFMKSKSIQQGVKKWDVTMYQTIYEEFMQHMRMDTTQKDIDIKPGYGAGSKFKIPSDFFTIFRSDDSVNVSTYCQCSDEQLLQIDFKSLVIQAAGITDQGLHSMIRQAIDSTTDTKIFVWRDKKVSGGRIKFEESVILGELAVMQRSVKDLEDHRFKIKRANGGVVTVYIEPSFCRIKSENIETNDW